VRYAWIAGLSFLSANLGALELMGWAAALSIRHPGHALVLDRRHPAMLFSRLGDDAVLLHLQTHSVPGYLKLRFGESSRTLSAVSFAFMTVLMSGINMYSMALVMKSCSAGHQLQHLDFFADGGDLRRTRRLRSAIFNEVLQFILIWPERADPNTGWLNRRLDQPEAQIARTPRANTRTCGPPSALSMAIPWHPLDGHRLRSGCDHLVRLLDHRFLVVSACFRQGLRAAKWLRSSARLQDDGSVHRDSPRVLGWPCCQ